MSHFEYLSVAIGIIFSLSLGRLVVAIPSVLGSDKRDFEFKAKVALHGITGRLSMSELVKKYDVHANRITDGKKQLLSGASDVFGKGAQKAEDNDKAIQVVHGKIGQLASKQGRSEGLGIGSEFGFAVPAKNRDACNMMLGDWRLASTRRKCSKSWIWTRRHAPVWPGWGSRAEAGRTSPLRLVVLHELAASRVLATRHISSRL